jgi:hypothetical protein
MDKKTKIAIIALAIIIVLLIIYGVSNKGPRQAAIVVPECSMEEYALLQNNPPDEECATQWVLVCENDSKWQHQCFTGFQGSEAAPSTTTGTPDDTVQVVDEELKRDLERQLEEARQQFYDICNQNPDLVVCG